MMRGYARPNDQFGVFMVGDLGIVGPERVEDLPAAKLPVRIGSLRLISPYGSCRFITLTPCREKDYRGEQVEVA